MQFLVYGIGEKPASLKPEAMAEMGKFMEEAFRSGIVVATGGLYTNGTRIQLEDAKVTVTDGPFIEAKDLIPGFAVIQVNSKEEAVEWTTRFRQILGDGQSEVVQVYGPA